MAQLRLWQKTIHELYGVWVEKSMYGRTYMGTARTTFVINEKGLIMLDDVCPHLEYSTSDKMYSSIASYETLKELDKQNLIKFNLIYKRLDSKYNCLQKKRKYVAIFKKLYG